MPLRRSPIPRRFILRRLRRENRISGALTDAHLAFREGRYTVSAVFFERLADGAQLHNLPRAPFLYLQAARSRLANRETAAGMRLFWQSMDLLIHSDRGYQAKTIAQQAADELESAGMVKEAGEIKAWLVKLDNSLPAAAPNQPIAILHSLPTTCPHCGGPIRSNEVAWLDPATAECVYCGNPIRGE